MNSAYGLIIVQPRSFRFPISVAADEWRLFGGAGKRAGKLFLHSVLDVTSLMQLDTSNTKAVSANVRLRYNYRPDSDFYIIYVGTQFASIAPANPPQVRETRFAVNMAVVFVAAGKVCRRKL